MMEYSQTAWFVCLSRTERALTFRGYVLLFYFWADPAAYEEVVEWSNTVIQGFTKSRETRI